MLAKESNVTFLNTKEIEKDEPEPLYSNFGDVEPKKGYGCEEDSISSNCNNCFSNSCCGYLSSPYCVAAVKHYF